jgi:hypothetical protein
MKDERLLKAVPGQKYLHYKGGLYIVHSLAKHTENDETLVIYQSIHYGTFYARPLDNWCERVEGAQFARFVPYDQ